MNNEGGGGGGVWESVGKGNISEASTECLNEVYLRGPNLSSSFTI